MLYHNYRKFIGLRQHFLRESATDIRARTVLVTGIPPQYQTVESLTTYFSCLNIGTVDQVAMNREVGELEAVLKKRFVYLDKLERAYMKLIRRSFGHSNSEIVSGTNSSSEQQPLLPYDQLNEEINLDQITSKRPTIKIGLFGLFGKRVDAINYYYSQYQLYDRKATEKRSQYYPPTSSAFVTFTTQNAANIAAQTLNSHKPLQFVTRMAREPRDIYWPNATIDPVKKSLYTTLVQIAVLLLVVLWTVPSTLVSSFLEWRSIVKYFPELDNLSPSPWVSGFLQGSLPTIAVAGLSSLFPPVMLMLSKLQGLRTYSSIQNAQMSKYFLLIFVNILLVFIIAGTVFKTIAMGFENLRELLSQLGEKLPEVSSFFINYVILQGFVVLPLFELTRAGYLLFGGISKLTCQTPRDRSEYLSPVFVNYGTMYSVPVLLFIVILTYSTISPLITIFGTLYSLIGYTIYRHHLIYVYRTRYDSGGSSWPVLFQRLLWGLILFQLTMTAVLSLKDVKWLSGLTFPLVFITMLFGYFCEQNLTRYAKVLSLDIASDLDATATPDSEDDPYYPREPTPTTPSLFNSSIRGDKWQSITRVAGVLDMQDTEYHHPALVGELPYLWLPKGYTSRSSDYFNTPST
ncbi:hypothetical protein K7432_002865 [Basidiobolus ranarum]|uniref:DUF221-domain-containing protein n=1 Tax=Basidiobolus ranarum TaxID=34480 RepID=A0ABR2X0V8_9FUNG